MRRKRRGSWRGLREAERIRAGKELLQAKRLEDELRLKRNLEERQREKAEVARAKEKIRIKLGSSPSDIFHPEQTKMTHQYVGEHNFTSSSRLYIS